MPINTIQWTSKISGKKYVIKEFTFGEDSMINGNAQRFDPSSGLQVTDVGILKIQTVKFGAALLENDKEIPLKEDMIMSMKTKEGNELFENIRAFNLGIPLESLQESYCSMKENDLQKQESETS